MIFDPAAQPFWYAQRPDPRLASWASDRARFERLGEIRRALLRMSPETATAKALATERRRLEMDLGLTCHAFCIEDTAPYDGDGTGAGGRRGAPPAPSS